MVYKKHQFGKIGEEEAEKYLKNLGYKIIGKNFRCKLGEIDLIALDGNFLVFVEVKSRSTSLFGTPAEAINAKKLNSMIKTSQFFIQGHKNLSSDIRFDAVEVFGFMGQFEINHIKNITL
ncbi:MAG: YraN family protein [Patescibacteria group bacterium]|nr:YraN family protein [Patescibacteria group bacterium]MCL5113871.1 YraN family protein [Patescibacteria group bacterium]